MSSGVSEGRVHTRSPIRLEAAVFESVDEEGIFAKELNVEVEDLIFGFGGHFGYRAYSFFSEGPR